MGKILKVLGVSAVAVILASCGKEDTSKPATSPSPAVSAVQAVPFRIEGVSFSDLYKDGLKVAEVDVGVNSGTTPQWTATAIAIAEKVATMGANSVEVSVRRDDIKQSHGVLYREVAHAYYSPDPKRTVWDDGQQWKVLQADPANLSTQRDVNIYEDYTALSNKLSAQGMNSDAADRKASIAIGKKYHLPNGWQKPSGNFPKEIARNSINVDAAPAKESLAALDRCMGGKIIRMMTTCGDDR